MTFYVCINDPIRLSYIEQYPSFMEIIEKQLNIGRVKVFDHDRGFGFIISCEDYNQYFVHITKINTGQIDAGDFVSFQLSPSRKKPGTMEAIKVGLVSELASNSSFLTAAYFRINDDEFKKTVLQTLGSDKVIKIVEQEVLAFQRIENEGDVSNYLNIYFRIQKALKNEMLSKGVKDIFSAWAEKVSNPIALMEFWLRGVLEVNPAEQSIQAAFTEADGTQKRKVFSRCDDTLRTALLNQLIINTSPIEVLSFISRFLQELNSLDYFKFVEKVNDPSYWSDKAGYQFLETAVKYYKANLPTVEILPLCLAGYPFEFPVDYVLENTELLSKEMVEKIISTQAISVGSRPEFYRSLLNTLQKEDDIETIKSYYKKARQVSDEEISFLDKEASQTLPSLLYFTLWDEGFGQTLPRDALKHFFQSVPSIQKVERWLSTARIKKEDIVSINIDIVGGIQKIQSRFEFYSFHTSLNFCRKYGIPDERISNTVHQPLKAFQAMSEWIDAHNNFDYRRYKPYFLFLNHEHQVLFLKAVFRLHHEGQMQITIAELKSLLNVHPPELDKSDVAINVTIDVLVRALEQLEKTRNFLVDYDLIAIALRNLSKNKTYKLQIGDVFEKCSGRTEAEYNWKTSGEITKEFFGNGQFYFAITIPTRIQTWSRLRGERWSANPQFDELLEAVKQIPGRKYNAQKEHWGVPSSQEEAVRKFAVDNRFFFKFEGSNYTNNPHLADFKQVDIPNGITYCEGRLANKPHQTFNREFWWCCNQACFQNCETIHSHEQWREYTFLDFLLILGYNLDDLNRVGDYIEKGQYYQFISAINRFNRLLERMYCHQCNNILQPVEDSHFAHHRVVRFYCSNSTCDQHKAEVYLHHCMNGKCNGIIDSRVSKKCPNGLYICSNEKCGCCCSNEMFIRREANLRTAGGLVPDALVRMIKSKAGHLENADRYCYRCGSKMNGNGDIFNCPDCNMRYDTTSTKSINQIRKRTVVESDTGTDF